MEERRIRQELIDKFPRLESAVTVQRERRIFVDAGIEGFSEVFEYAVRSMGFSILVTITGIDEGDSFSVIYHLSRKNSIVLNFKVRTGRENPRIPTVTQIFPNAEMYERELMDLLGIRIIGLAEGRRYPLPDEWPAGSHPLRKDWNPPAASHPEEAENI